MANIGDKMTVRNIENIAEKMFFFDIDYSIVRQCIDEAVIPDSRLQEIAAKSAAGDISSRMQLDEHLK